MARSPILSNTCYLGNQCQVVLVGGFVAGKFDIPVVTPRGFKVKLCPIYYLIILLENATFCMNICPTKRFVLLRTTNRTPLTILPRGGTAGSVLFVPNGVDIFLSFKLQFPCSIKLSIKL